MYNAACAGAHTPPLKSKSPLKVDQNACVLRSTLKGGSVTVLQPCFLNFSAAVKLLGAIALAAQQSSTL